PSKPKVQNIKFPPKNGTHQVQGNGNKQSGSFVSAVKGIPQTSAQPFSLPALVLDDSCLVTKDLDNCVMGEKIGSKWGEVMELEEDNVESFKIIVNGKVFRIRAKELFVWSPFFKKPPEVEHSTNDESVEEDIDNIVHD
ncbi:hypothetical protein Tco_0707796, partial [Tanacetum coccineum]